MQRAQKITLFRLMRANSVTLKNTKLSAINSHDFQFS